MTKRIIIFSLVFIIGIVSIISCDRKTYNTVSSIVTENSKASSKKPYLILISLDGFRWDYVEKYKPPHLINFIKNGINSESLIPSFPTKTFPNHYTIATGMYPDKHGIIANSFYSYDKDMTYRIRDREKVEDGSFYGGNPIWIQANRSNMVTASYFFVGTEANIQGLKPTYYYRFDNSVKNEVRVNQAIDWLKLPPKKRPHLITMYFSDMDDTGHKYGTKNDEELKKTLFELDTQLGVLFKGIEKIGLPVNIIIVSDHGMSTVPISKFIAIEKIENDSLYTSIDNGAIVNIHPNNKNQINSIYTLKKVENGVGYFDLDQVYTIKSATKDYKMELDGIGKGQIDFDIKKQFFTKFYLEMEMNLKTELEAFSIELQTKSITDQATEIIKASR